MLARGGAGLGSLTARQVCNVAFAIHTEGMTAEDFAEYRVELMMPLDPMAQYDAVMARQEAEMRGMG
jgi:hypothetical protein